jgi:hypothetical protein
LRDRRDRPGEGARPDLGSITSADPSEIQLIALHGASFRARRLRHGQVGIMPTLSVIGIHAATTAALVLAEIAAQC